MTPEDRYFALDAVALLMSEVTADPLERAAIALVAGARFALEAGATIPQVLERISRGDFRVGPPAPVAREVEELTLQDRRFRCRNAHDWSGRVPRLDTSAGKRAVSAQACPTCEHPAAVSWLP